MTDPITICPIPPDARVGDVVVLRNGEKRKITELMDGEGDYMVESQGPSFVHASGSWMYKTVQNPRWDCISFEYADGRKPNLPHTGKPKRTQAQIDGAYLRACIVKWRKQPDFTTAQFKRILTIVDRMEGKT